MFFEPTNRNRTSDEIIPLSFRAKAERTRRRERNPENVCSINADARHFRAALKHCHPERSASGCEHVVEGSMYLTAATENGNKRMHRSLDYVVACAPTALEMTVGESIEGNTPHPRGCTNIPGVPLSPSHALLLARNDTDLGILSPTLSRKLKNQQPASAKGSGTPTVLCG